MVGPKLELINYSDHTPYYIQLIEIIKEKIISKKLKSGDQIAGESDLCVEYGVSRTVVRQALRELELSGLIIRRKGKGTFVAEPKINEGLVQKLTGFYQDMTERGLKPITQVLHQQIVPADEIVARFLEIPIGTSVVDIKRLRLIEENPIQLVTTYIPFDLCQSVANIDLTNRSLYEYLEKEGGLIIARGRRYIEAVSASEIEASLLKVERGSPLIMLDSVSFLNDGRPIEYYHALHRGDRTRFEVELIRLREFEQPFDSVVKYANLPNSNNFYSSSLTPHS
jgi:GntR family transcriptional regulator